MARVRVPSLTNILFYTNTSKAGADNSPYFRYHILVILVRLIFLCN
jgi:hypothetical protein